MDEAKTSSALEADRAVRARLTGQSGDLVVDAVCHDLVRRSLFGQQKYGCTLTRTDLTTGDWIRHAYEEALDLACYLRRLLEESERREKASP
jgi:hypothetical protein